MRPFGLEAEGVPKWSASPRVHTFLLESESTQHTPVTRSTANGPLPELYVVQRI